MTLKDYFKLDTQLGTPIQINDYADFECKVVPEAQSMTIKWPFGGFVWNRPTAIIVEQDDEINRIPIIDNTRLVQLSLIIGALIFSTLILLISFDERRN